MPLKQSLSSFVKTRYSIAIFFLLSVAFFGLLIYFDSIFRIKNIAVKGTNTYLYGLDAIKNKSMIFTSEKSLEDQIYARNPHLSNIVVEKKFPSSINFAVQLYIPIVYIQTKEGYIELSENGRILVKTNKKEKNIPVINYYQSLPYQSYQTGEFITYKDVVYSLYFVKKLQDMGMKLIKVDITGFYMLRLYNDKNQSFVITTDKEKELQHEQLVTIIKQLKLKGQPFTSIDVRFDKPIATF